MIGRAADSARIGPGGTADPGISSPGGREKSAEVSDGEFREAMALLAAPLTIVATRDEHGRARGMTASAVTSVSLDPPLLLVCVSRTSSWHVAIARAEEFTVNVLARQHVPLARRFAARVADRFAGSGFRDWPGTDLPYLPAAHAALRCAVYDRKTAGDHDVLFGLVREVRADPAAEPLVWHRRAPYPPAG